MKFISFLLLVLVVSCTSTPKRTEAEYYLMIKGMMAGHHYSSANLEIIEFEKKYPKSDNICELLKIRLAYHQRQDLDTDELRNAY